MKYILCIFISSKIHLHVEKDSTVLCHCILVFVAGSLQFPFMFNLPTITETYFLSYCTSFGQNLHSLWNCNGNCFLPINFFDMKHYYAFLLYSYRGVKIKMLKMWLNICPLWLLFNFVVKMTASQLIKAISLYSYIPVSPCLSPILSTKIHF